MASVVLSSGLWAIIGWVQWSIIRDSAASEDNKTKPRTAAEDEESTQKKTPEKDRGRLQSLTQELKGGNFPSRKQPSLNCDEIMHRKMANRRQRRVYAKRTPNRSRKSDTRMASVRVCRSPSNVSHCYQVNCELLT